MRPKPLEVTRIFLSTCYTSLCDSSRCNTYSLNKILLIKHRRLVKCRWCLTSAPWTSSTSPSRLAIYTVNMAVKSQYSIYKASTQPRDTNYTHKSVYTHCPCIYGNARQSILHLKYCFQQNFIFENFYFENFIFRKFYQILFDFILF